MKEKERDAFRLSQVNEWVEKRAKRSTQPSVFLQHYQDALSKATVDSRVDYSDPTRLAAQIEALAARRRVQEWDTRDGLCLKALPYR